MTKSQVIFGVGRGNYSFDSLYVRAVERETDIRSLPGAPECIIGLALLRGELVPVCDLNKKFNTGNPTPADADVIFVNTSDGCLGCTVDRVVEIGAITEDLELELPYLVRNESTEYVAEIVTYKGDLITAIDQDNLLNDREKASLEKLLNKEKQKAEKKAAKEAEKAAKEAAEKAAKEAENTANGENA